MDNQQLTLTAPTAPAAPAPVVLYDSRWWLNGNAAADAIADYCDANEIAVPEEDSAEWWEIIYCLTEWDAEDFRDNLKWSKFGQRPAVVCGDVGTWQGRRDIFPKYFSTLEEAVLTCCQCDENKVTIEDGAIMVKCIHHDGTNHFCVRVIKPQYSDLADKIFFDNYGEITANDLPEEMFETIEEL